MRKKQTNRLKIGILVALIFVLFTGCDQAEEIDYSIEGVKEENRTEELPQIEDQPREEMAKSGLAQFEEGENWKETVTSKAYVMQMDGQIAEVALNMAVNAKIIVPDAKQMSVVEVTEQEFDEAFKETVAENIFEEGEIYYGDMAHLPKKELQEIRDFFDAGGVYTFSANSDELYVEPDWQAFWDAVDNMEEAGETYTPAEGYTVNEYIGTYEGREYDLTFAEAEGDYLVYYSRKKQMVLEARDMYEVCPENFRDKEEFLVCMPWMRGDWVDNQCELSIEEAEKEAREFAEQLGLDYPVHAYTRPLVWGTPPAEGTFVTQSNAEKWGINGYVCYFEVGVDDIPFVSYGMEHDYWYFQSNTEEDEEVQYSLNAQLQVYVTDKGIIKAIVNNPVEITGVSEGVELLPLDTIKGIMKEAMAEQWEQLRLETYTTDFNEMELIYFRVSDKENPEKYSYVPAWRLGAVSRDTVSHQISIRNQVLINAIDGSVISFYDET